MSAEAAAELSPEKIAARGLKGIVAADSAICDVDGDLGCCPIRGIDLIERVVRRRSLCEQFSNPVSWIAGLQQRSVSARGVSRDPLKVHVRRRDQAEHVSGCLKRIGCALIMRRSGIRRRWRLWTALSRRSRAGWWRWWRRMRTRCV